MNAVLWCIREHSTLSINFYLFLGVLLEKYCRKSAKEGRWLWGFERVRNLHRNTVIEKGRKRYQVTNFPFFAIEFSHTPIFDSKCACIHISFLWLIYVFSFYPRAWNMPAMRKQTVPIYLCCLNTFNKQPNLYFA